jgi:GNAT superfamily N-acetyltransferase
VRADAGGATATPTGRLHVRPLVTADLPDLFRIERDAYTPELRESEAAVLSKMALFRAGTLGCFDRGQMCGYAFALPLRRGTLVGVAQVLDVLPADPDVMYIHDMVVAPGHRRRHVASTLLAEIVRLAGALNLGAFALVAVQGSEPFWQRAGFTPTGTCEYVPGVRATRMELGRSSPPWSIAAPLPRPPRPSKIPNSHTPSE